MATFRFRAEAALQLRQKQEDAAAAALARAQAAFQAIEADRTRTIADRQAASERDRALRAAGTDAAAIEWHWNWINRLAAAVERLGRDLEAQRVVVTGAERAWRDARRRRLSLARMRDRALRRHERAELDRENKVIDELARLRFVMPDPTVTREDM